MGTSDDGATVPSLVFQSLMLLRVWPLRMAVGQRRVELRMQMAQLERLGH
jgi:hypothetical protein